MKLLIPAMLAKAHVSGYTNSHGTYVAEHEDRRAAAHRLAEKIRAYGPEFEPHVEEAAGGSVYVTVHKHEMTSKGKRHLRKRPTPMRYKARFADHGSYWGSTISIDPITGNSEDDAMAMFEHAANPKEKPRITSFNHSRIDPQDRVQYVSKMTYNENIHKNGGKDYWQRGPSVLVGSMQKAQVLQVSPRIVFLKSHISGYTNSHGTYVAPHEDKRSEKKAAHIAALEAYNNHKKEMTEKWGEKVVLGKLKWPQNEADHSDKLMKKMLEAGKERWAEEEKDGGAVSAAKGHEPEKKDQKKKTSRIVSGEGEDLVDLYHGTSEDNFNLIHKQGKLSGPVFMTPRKSAAQEYSGDKNNGRVISLRVPKSKLLVDLDLPGAKLVTVKQANRYLENSGQNSSDWTIDDYIKHGFSVGVNRPVYLESRLKKSMPFDAPTRLLIKSKVPA